MDFTTIFFIVMSIIVLVYLVYSFKTEKRVSLLLEVFYVGIYLIIAIIFIFPGILTKMESFLGIQSAINFIVYLSIFIVYLFILKLYRKSEDQRVEITKLTREIAFLKDETKK